MRIVAGIDLEPLRRLARHGVETQFARNTAGHGDRPAIYALKLAEAVAHKAGQEVYDGFAQEAAHRGLTLEAFADLVIAKDGEARAIHLAAEALRQRSMMFIDSMTTAEELESFVQRLRDKLGVTAP